MFPVLKRYVRRQFPNTYQRLDAAMDEVRRHHVRRLRTVLPLAESMSFTVQAGPFAGLRFPREAVTGSISCACLPKLLGIYEMECQKFVEELCTKSYKLVLNIGADEGYYAVGLARRIEYATVVAFETVEKSRSLCRQTAMLNQCATAVWLIVSERSAMPVNCKRAVRAARRMDPRNGLWLITPQVRVFARSGLALYGGRDGCSAS